MKFSATSPSNLALVKYMGKKDLNFPTNSSLSITLNHLTTEVELDFSDKDEYQGELKLTDKEENRFLNHLKFLKSKFRINQCFKIKSENNFPMGSGLASSASSFSALTLAFSKYLKSVKLIPDIKSLSILSRIGSGSSIRSFFSPWCLWDSSSGEAKSIDLPDYKFIFLTVLIGGKKKIPSSKAHKLIESSPLYETRSNRANMRLNLIIEKLRQDEWYELYQLVKAEFWDMMSLFHTAIPGFSYLEPDSIKMLNDVEKLWTEYSTGPLVTMDAGASVHLLFKPKDKELASKFKKNLKLKNIYHES